MASDAELISDSIHPDRAAFAALYDRHARAVFLYAWGVTRNTSDADDIVQEVFIVTWKKLRAIRIVNESALPWLLVTCRNVLRNHGRRALRTRAESFDEVKQFSRTTTQHDEAQIRRDQLAWVMTEIDKLDPADRQLCQLCLVDGYSYSEASRRLGVTTSTVAKRIERLRARLRARLGESDG